MSAMSMNWDALFDQWLRDCYVVKDASTGTIEVRRTYLRRLRDEVNDRSLWDLTQDDLIDWLNGHGWAANTRIVARSSIRSFYQWARKRGHITVDPTEEIPKPGTPAPRPRPVPNDTYAALLATVPAGSRERVALRLAGELALRRAEVTSIARENVVLDADGYWLRFVGKGNKERTVPCPDDIASELLSLIDSTPGDYAFPSIVGGARGHLTPHWMGTLISRLLPDGFTMHKLRHRAGTEAYRRSGNDIYLASKLLGHSSVTTTQSYVKADMSRLRAAITEIAS